MVSVVQEICRPATLGKVSDTRKRLGQTLKQRGVADHLSNKIQLCFSEAAANLLEHTEPLPTFIAVSLECVDGLWLLHIDDDGESWDPTLASRVKSLDTFEEKEGGRGLALIHSLTDGLEYTKRTTFGENRLTLKWSIQQVATRPCVLVVEDDDSQRRLISAYLSEHFKVSEASNGQDALQFLMNNNVDLVISDIRMPGMDGLDLKKALHNQTNTLLTPFIFLTYADSQEIRDNAMGLGIDDYILKPVTKSALVQSARRVLHRSEQIYRQLTDKVNHRITNALTPSLPAESRQWQIAFATRNTGIGGGDLVLHRDTDDFLMINMVDVMGHDVAAKFFSYAYGGYLRGLMYHVDDTDDPCGTLLSRLSDCAMDDNLLSQVILTCCSVALYGDAKFSVATAGHPAPIKVNEHGAALLDVGGIMPGVLYGADYKTQTTSLQSGERIAVYTDGLFEAADSADGRQVLEKAVMRELENTLSLPVAEAVQHVIQVFDNYGDWHRDDATIMLLEYVDPVLD
ncbi:response regulator [Grimontia kaedaensis]|uniref:Response regulator n=1 Tax=Grimontia kaedaensis TaxID=2872157 RepID=A0ABY4X1H1_9GAMM|nr:response regulator [Grimontia kaedaensis]USH05104.1 response regulator [Grimontia kaedaensis]